MNKFLPSRDVLQQSACVVAANMWGVDLIEKQAPSADAGEANDDATFDRCVELTLQAQEAFVVALAWRESDAEKLAVLFGLPDRQNNRQHLLADAMGEFINIVAGQLKTYSDVVYELGLPRLRTALSGKEGSFVGGEGHRIFLTSEAAPAPLRLEVRSIEQNSLSTKGSP